MNIWGIELTILSFVISASFKPFEVRVFTDEFEEQTLEDGATAGSTPQRGFQLDYVQLPC